MRAKLHTKASALGLDDAAYVRMLVFRDVNGPTTAVAVRERDSDPNFGARGEWLGEGPDPRQAPIEELVDADEPRAEDMDIPADADEAAPADLDQLLAGAGSLLDEMLEQGGDTPAAVLDLARGPAPRVPQRGYRTQLSNRDRGLVALSGPGSRTRPLGVNDQVVGGNNYGDGPGNVLRDNMRHFGFNGTRSR